MRLIDLDDHIYCGEDGDYARYNIDQKIPTIDAVPVVRCQNCKYSYVDEKTVVCGLRGFFVRDGFFCSNGERREDETDLDVCVSAGCDIIND